MKQNENKTEVKSENKPAEKKKTSFVRSSAQALKNTVKKRTDAYLERRVANLLRHDTALTEPLHGDRAEAARPILEKGSVDGWFLLFSILLTVFGAIMSYSASSIYAQQEYGDSMYVFKRYLFYAIAASLFTLLIILFATPQMWKGVSIVIYGASIILLLLVLVVGSRFSGAQRWIDLGFITLQPSEIAKTGVVMMLALYLSAHEKQVTSKSKWGGSFRHGVLMPGILIGIIIVLVMLEKHISGIMIIGMISVAVLFVGGTRMKWLGSIGGALVGVGAFLIICFPYARARVESWINLENDPLGDGWQTLQGLNAIGSGSLFGVGLGNSNQKYGYVSEPQNDFIFSIICEELGFIGAALTILLFSCLVFRGFQIAAKAPNRFCALTVYGLSFKVALQAALNIAVVTNMMPNTGISLPFFSSGGTSLALQIFEIGIILSISRFSALKKE